MAGKTNAADWQKSHTARRVAIIKNYIRFLLTSKVKFDNLTALAESCAAHISKQEGKGKPCHASTLLRNKNYSPLLMAFMTERLNGNGLVLVGRKQVSDPAAKLLLTKLELDAENMRREKNFIKSDNDRLKNEVASLISQVEELKSSTERVGSISDLRSGATDIVKPPSLTCSKIVDYKQYSLICEALRSVLAHCESILTINPSTGTIDDLVSFPRRVLVDSVFVKPYLEWLKEHQK